jgi:hypothetical protein
LWSRTVIWTSILGSFLTIIGLYLGIAQFKRGKDEQLSAYRGLFYWHHLAGLVFGVVSLAFVASGLVSMNPWGFLDSRGGGERARLEGPSPHWAEVKASILELRARSVPALNLSLAPYGGKLLAGDRRRRLRHVPRHVRQYGDPWRTRPCCGGDAAGWLRRHRDAGLDRRWRPLLGLRQAAPLPRHHQ